MTWFPKGWIHIFFFGGGEEIAIFWHPQTRITLYIFIYIYITYPISHHGDIRKKITPWTQKVAGRWGFGDMFVLWRVVTKTEPASSPIFRLPLRRFSVGLKAHWRRWWIWIWDDHSTRENFPRRSEIAEICMKILWDAICHRPRHGPCRWGTSFTASVSTSGFEHLNEDLFVPSTRLGCVYCLL